MIEPAQALIYGSISMIEPAQTSPGQKIPYAGAIPFAGAILQIFAGAILQIAPQR